MSFLYFGLQAPSFLGPESLGNIINQSSFIGIAAVGMTVVLLTGGIDLSVGSAMYLGPLIAGMLMKALGLSVTEGLAIAVLAGILIRVFNALFIAVLMDGARAHRVQVDRKPTRRPV